MSEANLPNWLRQAGWGTAFWFVFLVALLPGQAMNAATQGATFHLDQEALRILGASILASIATPVVAALVRRYPIEPGTIFRRAVAYVAAGACIAILLIAVSCILAPLAGIGDTRPFAVTVLPHIAANWLPLTFALLALCAIMHCVRFFGFLQATSDSSYRQARPTLNAPAFLDHVHATTRGHLVVVDLADVDWIETQGNYLALHTKQATHLVRETLTGFAPRLDPRQFTRIHRRMMVANKCVREVEPLANGDALVRLSGGAALKASRNYRSQLRSGLDALRAIHPGS